MTEIRKTKPKPPYDPHPTILPEDVEHGKRKDPRSCPLARAINRELDKLPLPETGPAGVEPYRPYVEVYGGNEGRGWIRLYHPVLRDYMITELDEEDSVMVRAFDATGTMPANTTAKVQMSWLLRNMTHDQGIPPEGLPIPEASKVLGIELHPEDDGEYPEWIDTDEQDTYPRYYCHCFGCCIERGSGSICLDSDYGDGFEPEYGEGWDENRSYA